MNNVEVLDYAEAETNKLRVNTFGDRFHWSVKVNELLPTHSDADTLPIIAFTENVCIQSISSFSVDLLKKWESVDRTLVIPRFTSFRPTSNSYLLPFSRVNFRQKKLNKNHFKLQQKLIQNIKNAYNKNIEMYF